MTDDIDTAKYHPLFHSCSMSGGFRALIYYGISANMARCKFALAGNSSISDATHTVDDINNSISTVMKCVISSQPVSGSL